MNYKKQIINPSVPFASLHTALLMLVVMFFAFSTPASAKKDKKSKRKVEITELNYEPDQICHKAKPDRHPNSHKTPPNLAYFSSGGGGPHLEGFDISHYQGKIDWQQLSTDPNAGFVYLKATEGANIIDNTYKQNLLQARQHGIKVGSYHFFRPNNSAVEQFNNFRSCFDPHHQDLLPMVDVEVMPSGISKSRFDACLSDLLQLIEKEYGRRPIIYTGKNFYNKHFHGSSFSSYKFWIAAYADEQPELNEGDDYLIWQYSAKGRAKGIKGYVDTNRFVGRHVLSEIKY